MKIRKLQLKNIGVFDDETIEFQECPEDKAEIHIFTGQNGSGKTTILTALAGVFDIDQTKNSLRKRFKKLNNAEEENKISVEFDNSVLINVDNSPNPPQVVVPNRDKISQNEFIALHHPILNYLLSLNSPSPQNLTYAVFALSGYRHIQSEQIEAHKELKGFTPLSQALDFIKDYSQENQLSINQLIVNNISNRALAISDGSIEEAKKYEKVIKGIENVIFEVTGKETEFVLKRQPNELKLKINGEELDFDVLPDGLRSLISWIADLLGRIDMLKWQDDLPIFEKNLILLLDEIEVHLHPAWQRKVLPVVQKLFKNSQIFVSTHSPFVVNSIDDAWVYKLELENGKAKVAEIIESENSNSITQVLREVFGIEQWFGLEVQNNFDRFKELKNKILSNGADETVEKELLEKAKILADEPNDQLKQMIREELEELSEIKQKPYLL